MHSRLYNANIIREETDSSNSWIPTIPKLIHRRSIQRQIRLICLLVLGRLMYFRSMSFIFLFNILYSFLVWRGVTKEDSMEVYP